jgi:hypothetical protein
MNKLGEIILIAAVILFVVVGMGILSNVIPQESSLIAPLTVTALIATGAGVALKKKQGSRRSS